MNDDLMKGSIYKVKEGKTVDEVEEVLTKYVMITDLMRNPLIKDYDNSWYVCFVYVYENTYDQTSNIWSSKVLSYEEFKDNFDLYLSYKDIKR